MSLQPLRLELVRLLIPAFAGPLASAMTAEELRAVRPRRQLDESGTPGSARQTQSSVGEPADRSAKPRTDPDSDPDSGPDTDPDSDPADDAGTRRFEAQRIEIDVHQVDAQHAEIWLLVQRAQTGDGDAFGELYDRYVDMVYRFIFYRVHDRQLAEDFTSETFLRALRRISVITYQGRDIGAWFMTIARNIVLDHVKSARNRLEFTTGDIIEDERSEPSPETAVLAMLSNERLMTAVNALGDEQRECVVLRFIQGLSVAETAEIMGKKEGAIKALQHRAVRKLAGEVGNDLK